jgi:hypothetical protein
MKTVNGCAVDGVVRQVDKLYTQTQRDSAYKESRRQYMQTQILPYIEKSKQGVKQNMSSLLTTQSVRRVARNAFAYDFENDRSLAFQQYYQETVSNQDGFLSAPDFFKRFKQQYALQGIDGAYLDRLETDKRTILHLIGNDDLAVLYFRYFADAQLRHKKKVVSRTLGSFFSKLVHTFAPDKYCALDNPIKKYLKLGNESFYIAFFVVSHAYREWVVENPGHLQQIRQELEQHKRGREFSACVTDLKLLDLIYWYQANIVRQS